MGTEQRYMTLYGCPSDCLNIQQSSANLAKPVTKTAKGTCVGFLAGSLGCVETQPAGDAIDCSGCTGIFNNVAPLRFVRKFKSGPSEIPELIARTVQAAAQPDEQPGNVAKVSGDDLALDNTAICHTASEFKCGQGDQNLLAADFISMADVEALAAQPLSCTETESVKITDMCNDGPCDNDSGSRTCIYAKEICRVDPDSGVYCMPGSENDPCSDCKCKGKVCDNSMYKMFDSGKVVSIALTSVLVFLAAVL